MSGNKAIREAEVDTDKLKGELEAWWLLKRESKLIKKASGLAVSLSIMLQVYLVQFDLPFILLLIISLAAAGIIYSCLVVVGLQQRLAAVICILQNMKSRES